MKKQFGVGDTIRVRHDGEIHDGVIVHLGESSYGWVMAQVTLNSQLTTGHVALREVEVEK